MSGEHNAFNDLVHSPRFTSTGSTVDRTPPTVDGPPATEEATPIVPRRRRKPVEQRWDARHVRRTFHLPVDISAAFDAEVAADEDLSLAAAATEAIEAWLRRRKTAARKGNI